MGIEIRSCWTNAVLFVSETAKSIAEAVYEGLNRSADLSGADLSGANLRSANGVNKLLTSPLYMLMDQPGLIRSYKLVTAELQGPHHPGITYALGALIECDADTDESKPYSYGINIATLDWVMREWSEGMRIMIVEHAAEDIACVPFGTDGKYRVHRCRVVGEKDLTQIGLADETPKATA